MDHNVNRTIQNLTILNFNANGLKKQRSLFIAFLSRHNVDIACISETHLIPTEPLRIPGYRIYRHDRTAEQASGGAAILIRRNIEHHPLDLGELQTLEAVSIAININDELHTLIAAYKRPIARWSENDVKLIFDNTKRTMVVGDLNSKNIIWNCRTNNPSGHTLNELCGRYSIYISAPSDPTYFPNRSNAEPDILDIVLMKNIRIPITQTVLFELDSDHVPVLITFDTTPKISKPPPRLITGHVNWEIFQSRLDALSDCSTILQSEDEIERTVEKFIRITTEAIHQATTENKKRYPAKRSMNPPQFILGMIKEKNEARRQWQRTRLMQYKQSYNRLNHKVKWELENHRINTYRNYISQIKPGDPNMWQATKRILKQTDYMPVIKTNDTNHTTDLEKCEVFASHLENVFKRPAEDSFTHHISGYIKNNIPNQIDEIELTTVEEVEDMIKKLPIKKAPGHDLIPNVVIKNFSTFALEVLTKIFNACLCSGYFPKTWKHAEIILFSKPGKNKSNPSSYRPISLLPTLSKLLEKVIKKRLCKFINENSILPPLQFGFRDKHSTTHQLQRIIEIISTGFERKQYTVGVFLDIAQAFDRVWIEGVIYKIIQNRFPKFLTLIISSFLRNRTFSVRINATLSTIKNISAGVPQGAVLAPLLFNVFVSDIPTPPNINVAMYADDTAVFSQSNDLNSAIQELQRSIIPILEWCERWKITVNADKSQAKVFTLRRVHNPPNIVINGEPVAWNLSDEAVKYLGVYLDQRLTWGFHINKRLNTAYSRLGMLYPLMNRTSPLKIECSLLLYKSIIRPIMTYACVIWSTAAKTHKRKMQVFQNKVIRIICNAPWYVRNDQLHEELALPTIDSFIRSSVKKHFTNLRSCSGARHYNLGKKTSINRLAVKRLPQDVFLSSDSESE